MVFTCEAHDGHEEVVFASDKDCGLRARNILYAPDYVSNAGGMIQLAMERLRRDRDETERRVRNIGETLAKIFRMADAENLATDMAADRLVQSRLRPHAAQAASA